MIPIPIKKNQKNREPGNQKFGIWNAKIDSEIEKYWIGIGYPISTSRYDH